MARSPPGRVCSPCRTRFDEPVLVDVSRVPAYVSGPRRYRQVRQVSSAPLPRLIDAVTHAPDFPVRGLGFVPFREGLFEDVLRLGAEHEEPVVEDEGWDASDSE